MTNKEAIKILDETQCPVDSDNMDLKGSEEE